MSSESIKSLIFISYAHLDEPEKPHGEETQWLTFVMRFLRPAVKSGAFTMWVDRQMPGGTEWNTEIEAKIRSCDIFILLVSAHSMGSDYIVDKEISIVRERQRSGDDFYFYPLLLDWTPRAGLEQVNDENLRPRDGKPFSSLSPSERSRAMAEVADEIADVAKAIEARKAAAAAEKAQISELAERAKIAAAIVGKPAAIVPNFAIEGIAPFTPVVTPPPRVDIAGLPETGYERLVGRDAELARLDQAWSDGKTNVLSLIAEGGAGKSALVNEWPTRLQADGYRGAESVLGWSFYSQGSKERATAADEFLTEFPLAVFTAGRPPCHCVARLSEKLFREEVSADTHIASANLQEAVEHLRASDRNDQVPSGLIARAAFRRAVGYWEGAGRDLDEAEEIAEPGPMRLYLCDIALECARLALARIEAFAPLNRLVEPSPTPPTLPYAAAAAVLKGEALKQLDIARKLIGECGYHRRDGELAELDAAAGRRRSADLPPRV
jgi:hypothetical protein